MKWLWEEETLFFTRHSELSLWRGSGGQETGRKGGGRCTGGGRRRGRKWQKKRKIMGWVIFSSGLVPGVEAGQIKIITCSRNYGVTQWHLSLWRSSCILCKVNQSNV